MASFAATWCNSLVVVRSKWLSLSLVLALTGWGCKASFSVNVNDAENEPSDSEVGTDDPGDAEGRGRSIESHSSDATPTVTLPGFRMFEDGTSRVFMEVSADVPVSESKNHWQLSYRFAGVRVPERVNRLPIPTTHFKSPVSLVQVLQVGDDAELRITLRQDTKPRTRLKRGNGGTVLSVDFPKWRDGQVDHDGTGQVQDHPGSARHDGAAHGGHGNPAAEEPAHHEHEGGDHH